MANGWRCGGLMAHATPTPTASRPTGNATNGLGATGSSGPLIKTCPSTSSPSNNSPETCFPMPRILKSWPPDLTAITASIPKVDHSPPNGMSKTSSTASKPPVRSGWDSPSTAVVATTTNTTPFRKRNSTSSIHFSTTSRKKGLNEEPPRTLNPPSKLKTPKPKIKLHS